MRAATAVKVMNVAARTFAPAWAVVHSVFLAASVSSAHVFPAHFLTKAALASAAAFWAVVHSVFLAASVKSAHVLPAYFSYKALAAASFSAAVGSGGG